MSIIPYFEIYEKCFFSPPLWMGGAKRRGGLHKNELSDHLPGSAGTPPPGRIKGSPSRS